MYNNIIKILKENNIEFDEIEHNVSTTCEDSKKFREDAWLTGLWSKNLVFHCKENFYIIVTHANKKINAKRFKKEFGSKNIRFANSEEIKEQINWTIWCIPSFGFKNTEIPIFIDSEIFEHEYFMFNPWIPTKTIRIKTGDLNNIFLEMKNPVEFFIWGEENMEIIKL